MQTKAAAADFDGRFREIIAGSRNLLIRRHPAAGTVADGLVTLHNGHRVPLSGPGAQYGDFSRILIYNRGLHEPLEEFAFQCLLPHLPPAPVLLELGPIGRIARCGWPARGLRPSCIWWRPTLLHCDLQGHEGAMLAGAGRALGAQRIDWLFLSTHGQQLHDQIVAGLRQAGYRIEVASDFDTHTTSFDGFVMAAASHCPAVLSGLPPPLGALIGQVRIGQAADGPPPRI